MRKVLLMVFCLIQSIGFAQEPLWGPTAKIKNSFNQKIVGETDSDIFLLTSDKKFRAKKNNLIRFSKKLSVKNELELEFKEKADAFVDAFIIDDKIRTIYFNKKSTLIFEDFDFSGSLLKRKELTIPGIIRDMFRPMGAAYVRFSYFKSDDNAVLCISQEKYMIIVDNTLEIVRTINFEPESELIDVHVSNNNVYYLLEKEETRHLYKSNFKESNQKLKLTFPDYNIWNLSLNYSNTDDKLYVTSLFGGGKKKERKALGVYINLIDKAELTELMTSEQKFNDETLLAASGNKKLENTDGLKTLNIRNTFYENGRFVFVIEESTGYESKLGTGMEAQTQTVSKIAYNDFILLSFTEKESFQKIIERDYNDTPQYLYMMSSFSTYKNGKLYLAYHQKHVKYHLNHYIFDSSLNQEFHKEVDTYKLRGIYYGVNEGIDAIDNSVLFYGRYQNKVGLARIKLD